MRTLRRLLLGSAFVGCAFHPLAVRAQSADAGDAQAQQAAPQNPTPTPKGASETMVVTGTRGASRAARQSTSPISVISAAAIERSAELNLADALARVYPSINVGTMGNDAGALTSAVRMRGLSPNEVLVLVDGKRRHTTANLYADSGPNFGSTPVDLNMIPAAMIDHVEVLEDGAAAQYGSDAIAGVVNIITRKAPHGLKITGQTGANAYNGDGWQYQLGADGGVSLGGDGYLNISGQMYHSDHMVVDTPDHQLLGSAPPGAGTALYTGPVRVPTNSEKVMSTPEETRETLGINFGKTLSEGVMGYGQITYAHRHAEAYENYRVPSVAPTLYPWGFSPLETIEENDYAATLGLKGDHLLGFAWDISTTYGADEDDIGDKNTYNAGMLSAKCISRAQYPATTSAYASTDGCGWSPTTVRSESYRMAQWTNNADFHRTFHLTRQFPLNFAFGAEHRLETYKIVAGNPPSYEAGGTAGYVGIQPQSAGNWNRDIWAGYLDADMHPLRNWDVDLAGRFEHYTDVGNTENGKISTRYDVTRRIALRATISNGFRAPTMAEQHFSSINVGATTVGGLLPISSSAARDLGASALKPERSTNLSGGIVLEPVDGFHIEADAYQINLRDRIIAGGATNGPAAEAALQKLGFVIPSGVEPAGVSTYFFANGASTRTQGLDIKADYLLRMHRFGNLDLSMALDLNRTRLQHVGSALVNGVNTSLLNAATMAAITTEYPRSKIVLNAFWTIGDWDVNIRQTRYGQTTAMLQYQDYTPSSAKCYATTPPSGLRNSNACFTQFQNSPRWLTDLEIGYHVNRQWHVAVGANDIFNVRPRRVPEVYNNIGGRPYDVNSANVPMTGGYYYGRVDATF